MSQYFEEWTSDRSSNLLIKKNFNLKLLSQTICGKLNSPFYFSTNINKWIETFNLNLYRKNEL